MWSHFGVGPETQSGAALSGSQVQVSCRTVWLANHMREIQVCPQARFVHNRTNDIGTRGLGHNGANNLHWGAVGAKQCRCARGAGMRPGLREALDCVHATRRTRLRPPAKRSAQLGAIGDPTASRAGASL